ncbi:hypothetical protein Tco_1012996 [Tanacetum coccineum]
MGTIDSVKSILTQSALDALCEKFYIPDIVHPELPGRNDRIRNSPTDILEYFQINLSQLSVIAAAKVSHFKILYRVYGFVPTVDPYPTPDEFDADVCNFLVENLASFWKFPKPFLCFVSISRYYDLDENCYPTIWDDDDEEMDLFAFIHHADPTKVRTGEKEVRDGEVSLLELTRGRIVPLTGVDEQENQNEVVQDEGVRGIDIVADDETQAIIAEKPKKVRKKRKAVDGASGSGLPPKKLREDHDTSRDVGASTIGKSLAALQGLLDSSTLAVEVGATTAATVPFVTSFVTLTPEREDGGHADSITGPNLRTQLAAGRFVVLSDSSHHSSTNAADDEVTSIVRSSMPPPPVLTAAVATTIIAGATSALVLGAGTEPVPHSIFRDSASTSETNQDVAGPSHPAETELSTDSFFVSLDVDLETLHQTYIPKWNVTNDSALDDPDLFVEFNVGAARQTCLSSEVRLRLKHELRGRKNFVDKCAMQTGWLKERDAKIANLKAQLSLKEAKAAEAIRLHGQIATVEAVEAARASELEGLKERNAALEGHIAALKSTTLSCNELSIKASSLEFEKDKLVDQVSKLEGTCSELRDEMVAKLDANLMGMDLHLDEEFYPRYLTTTTGRRWILSRGLRLMVMKCLQSPEYLAALGGAIGRAIDKGMKGGLAVIIDHGKARRDLTGVAAYDPSAEANYMSAVSALRTVNFPLLSQLESHKDTNIADLMGLLHLEGPTAKTPEAIQLQPSPGQLMLPIHRLEDQVVIGETSLYFSLDVANARVQRLKRNDASQQLSISDALVPLIEPLSAENLVGEASTFIQANSISD